MKYGPLPIGWHLTAEHVNSEGERMGIASCHNHPQFGDARLLIVWDAPIPLGTGVAAMTLIDTGVIEWLQEGAGAVTATVHEFARRKRPHTAAPSGTGAAAATGATPVATTPEPFAGGGGHSRRPAHVPSSSVSHIAAGRPAPPEGGAAA